MDSIRQLAEGKIADLKHLTRSILNSSPPDITSAIISNSGEAFNTFNALFAKIIDTRANFVTILGAWEHFDKTVIEFDASLRRTQEKIAKYEYPFSKQLCNLQGTVDMISTALNALQTTANSDQSAPTISLEVGSLKELHADVSKTHEALEASLKHVSLEPDQSSISALARRSEDLEAFTTLMMKTCASWTRVAELFQEFNNQKARLEEKTGAFEVRSEALANEEMASKTLIGVTSLLEQSRVCLGDYQDSPVKLKGAKDLLSSLTPFTSNATILELQGELTGLWTRLSSAQQAVRSLMRRCEERIECDSKLKTEFASHTLFVTGLENELQALSSTGRLTGDSPLPKPLCVDSMQSAEMSFSFFTFSTNVTDFINQSRMAVSHHANAINAFKTKLLKEEREIAELLCQEFLEDGMVELAKENLVARLDRIFKAIAKQEEVSMKCLNTVTDVNSGISKILENLSLRVEAFLLNEDNSRSASREKLDVVQARLKTLTEVLENDVEAVATVFQLISSPNDQEWVSYKNVERLLMDDITGLRSRVQDLSASLAEEITDLTKIASLQSQIIERHSAFLAKLSIVPSLLPTPTKKPIYDGEEIVDVLNKILVKMRSAHESLVSERNEFNRVTDSCVSTFCETVQRYANHRRQPYGLFVCRIDQHKVALEEACRKSGKLEQEVADELRKWEAFLDDVRELRHVLAVRESDLQVFTTTGTIAERAGHIRDIEESLDNQINQLLDKMVASGSAVAPLRSNSDTVTPIVTALTTRYETLRKTVTCSQNDIRTVILADEDLKKDCAACMQMLANQEVHLNSLCNPPIVLSSGSYALDGLQERIQKVNAFSKELNALKKDHLTPFDSRVRLTKTQLKDCGFDESDVDSVDQSISEMWKLFDRLQQDSTAVIAELKSLSRACGTFFKLSEETSAWLKTQQESFAMLVSDISLTDCADIQQLTSQLSERANAIHKLFLDLHASGERHLAGCSSECSRLLGVIQTTKGFTVQNPSNKNLTQKNLLGGLQEQHASLLASATRRKDEISAVLLSLTAYDELFSGLQSWMLAVESEMSRICDGEADDGSRANMISLWSTPSSYLAIRSSSLLSRLARFHERAIQIADKQAHLDVLLTRSNQLLEEQPSSGVSRFVAQRVGVLSRTFVQLTAQVMKHIEQSSVFLKGIEKLQESRDAYGAWEKGFRSKLAQAKLEETPSKVLMAVKSVAASLPMGDVLLDTCRRWSISVQNDVLGTTSAVSQPMLATDLIASYTELQKTISQYQLEAEKTLTDLQVKQVNFTNASSWLDAAERRLTAIWESINSPPPGDLRGTSIESVLMYYEQRASKGVTELTNLHVEVMEHNDSQLTSKLYAFKARLAQLLKNMEERLKELRSHREATNIVMMRQQLALERFAQTTGEPVPESAFQLKGNVVRVVLSSYDAERRLTVLQGLHDELVMEGRHLLEVMIDSADQLISTEDAFLTEVVTEQSEQLRCQQAELERLTRWAIEQLEEVSGAWKRMALTEEMIDSWLTEAEQAMVRPNRDVEASIVEKKKTLEAMKVGPI